MGIIIVVGCVILFSIMILALCKGAGDADRHSDKHFGA